ncbi:hypothetical protein [Sulfurimonas sp.]|nr:hypothetical protein [Sulfurimonas sp.]
MLFNKEKEIINVPSRFNHYCSKSMSHVIDGSMLYLTHFEQALPL